MGGKDFSFLYRYGLGLWYRRFVSRGPLVGFSKIKSSAKVQQRSIFLGRFATVFAMSAVVGSSTTLHRSPLTYLNATQRGPSVSINPLVVFKG